MRKTVSQEMKLKIGRNYANHIINTGDSQTHTAYLHGVSPSTIHTYINGLKDSPLESDVELYKKVTSMTKSRRWGYNFIKA